MLIERDQHGFDAPAPLGHPARAGLPTGHPTWPATGERLPNFSLPDSSGKRVEYEVGRKSVVVFYRSAV